MVACPHIENSLAGSTIERVVAPDGVRLCVERFGKGGRPVHFAHGFGQSRHAWADTASALAREGYHCTTIDSRGHGDSAWSDAPYRFETFIDDVTLLAETLGPKPAYVGASMGGLLGIMAASRRPGLFSALVLVDVTPRWEVAGVERILTFMRAYPDGFASIDEARGAVAKYLPHRASAGSTERLKKYLVPTDNGRLRWHWDPKLLDTVARDSDEWPAQLAAAARTLSLPVLLISGGKSDVVSDHTIEEFLALAPHAGHVRIDDATHMVVGDANDRFTHAVSAFLSKLTPAGAP